MANIIVDVINASTNQLPVYETEGAAGMDLRAAIQDSIVLGPLERVLVPTGLSVAIPLGYEIQIRPRSGMAYKYGITVLNTPGTIDADYRGEIKLLVINLSNSVYTIENGDRLAQAVIAKHDIIEWNVVTELPSTDRGTSGFGSTGEN